MKTMLSVSWEPASSMLSSLPFGVTRKIENAPIQVDPESSDDIQIHSVLVRNYFRNGTLSARFTISKAVHVVIVACRRMIRAVLKGTQG
jgi:hypothetical protein